MADEDMVGSYIGDMSYPASKGEIVSHAQEKGATEGVVGLLRNLPEKEYKSMDEVTEAVGMK